ncbi:SEL1-like repeat protein [Chryseobacterium populi]|uniref:Sel1 repeat protein n=1 Tax=Chryseobacterium populi TaxID=1144316 RepID=J2T0K9_9FLAO|nr:hypothetical protein [Chryseobacterium populi]EJL71487.1 hypothetical protein PMI13_02333 [Chryseobacterium populi]
MKINQIIIVLGCIISLICCKQEGKEIMADKNNITSEPVLFDINNDTIKENLNDAIKKGDTIAYLKSLKIFTTNGYEKEFLYYAMKMAEEQHYPLAYENVYTILLRISDENGYRKDSKIGEYYLLKAYELGSKSAKYNLENFYKNKPIPTSASVLK